MNSEYWPFVVFAASVALIAILIVRLRFHPFVALILSAVFVALLSPGEPVTALELPLKESGSVAGNIAWVIALAALIGTAMMKSGAAEQIVNWLLKTLGEARASLALLLAGFILSIPVFFDTVFFLLIPVGIALARTTGRDFVLYVVAISGGRRHLSQPRPADAWPVDHGGNAAGGSRHNHARRYRIGARANRVGAEDCPSNE